MFIRKFMRIGFSGPRYKRSTSKSNEPGFSAIVALHLEKNQDPRIAKYYVPEFHKTLLYGPRPDTRGHRIKRAKRKRPTTFFEVSFFDGHQRFATDRDVTLPPVPVVGRKLSPSLNESLFNLADTVEPGKSRTRQNLVGLLLFQHNRRFYSPTNPVRSMRLFFLVTILFYLISVRYFFHDKIANLAAN